MKKGLPPIHSRYSEEDQRIIRSRSVKRTFHRLSVATTILSNGLDQMMVIADSMLGAIDNQKGGIAEFKKSTQQTRQAIAHLIKAVGRNENDPLKNQHILNSLRCEPDEVIRKVRSGLTGVRNAIVSLLENHDTKTMKAYYQTMEFVQRTIDQLVRIDLLLSEFQSKEPQAFLEILKDPKWKIGEKKKEASKSVPKKRKGRPKKSIKKTEKIPPCY